ncbi:phosphatidylserine decarboxylase [Alteromonadaceae bacterium M269]|nr:phosphatidylserine decarboxylase [Alteromonadaceae bacterium M269]
MLDFLKVKLQYILPKHAISRLVGYLAAAEAGSVTTKLIELFIKQFNVDMSEAADPDPESYKTFNSFFTRELKAGVRPLCEGENTIAQPVDGAISQLGDVKQGRIFQAKGHDFGLTELLGGDPQLAAPFVGGKFATVYLSPKDYHRIHMPLDGTLTDMLHVPGDLFSVNPLTAENVPGLFARNERVVSLFDSPKGKFALVLVGATIVASIETVWSGTVAPLAPRQVQQWQYPSEGEQAVHLNKGDEMGRFKLGSTIVLVFEPDMAEFEDFKAGDTTRMGEHFASLIS